MRERLREAGIAGLAALGLATPLVAAGTGSLAADQPTDPTTTALPPDPQLVQLQQELAAAQRRSRRWRRRAYALRLERDRLRLRWWPTVDYALRLGSAVSGVSYWQLRSVAHCESTLNPAAASGRYRGLFQLSWSPLGFSPFDPVASAISTGLTVRREGWRQWTCKP